MSIDLSQTDLASTSSSECGEWINRFRFVRQFSERIAAPLSAEDCGIQTMPDVSPTRWHLAHTTWFFETFILKNQPNYTPFDERFEYLFNSYYNAVGEQFPRWRRGAISRPGLDEILAYRHHVDAQVERLLGGELDAAAGVFSLVELGLNHEQQHQELMLTDIKHVLFANPLFPVYASEQATKSDQNQARDDSADCAERITIEETITDVGYSGDAFHFDNEGPQHRTLLQPHQISNRLVTNREFVSFVDDGGYEKPEYWLSLGWQFIQQENIEAPLYWRFVNKHWSRFGLDGIQPLDLDEPVCHVSYFEADAFSRWVGARLPTEFEWEFTANSQVGTKEDETTERGFADSLLVDGVVHPIANRRSGARSWLGNVWEWTASHYSPYPGFRPDPGAIGEYNGKFMCNQFVLRGGSCATSSDHIRVTYRNFFPPDARWQFSGVRLAW